MRTHHFLAALATALLAVASWAQSHPVLDPTGSVWLNEQIAAARRPTLSEASAPARQPVARSAASTKDDTPKVAELKRPGQVTRQSIAATAP